MSKEPILILQMQRMGDLLLSFPLLGWLEAACPGHPLWLVGEGVFFGPLLKLSPQATYFSYDMAPNLEKTRFEAVINLSHRPEAAALAGRARTGRRIGPWRDKDGSLRITGDWQIYRASLTRNNRHNLYHWADLNALDCIPEPYMRHTVWPKPRPLPRPERGGARVGLFLGASKAEKHPDAVFWAALAGRLMRAGDKPVLLGGPHEAALGRDAAALAGIPAINLCGRFNVDELARFLARLDVLVTPDTGPMHLAAWIGTPVLNISLGPVSAWETGPRPPGHHVLRANLDCVGCWLCDKERQLCREAMTPDGVAATLERIRRAADDDNHPGNGPARLELLRTASGAHDLFELTPVSGGQSDSPRLLLSRFWRAWFGAAFGRTARTEAVSAFSALGGQFPESADILRRALASFSLVLVRTLRGNGAALAAHGDFWRAAEESARPFAGYAQMLLHNEDGNISARARVLAMAEDLSSFG